MNITEYLAGLLKQPVVIPAPVPVPVPSPIAELITLAQLIRIMPKTWPAIAPLWIAPLNQAMSDFEINNRSRMGMFLAQIAHESAELTKTEENLNYSADGLRRTFPKYFLEGEFELFARQPERIANRVYGARNGNLGTGTGDGWRYRGRGPIMLTGRNNYRDAGKALGLDLVSDPDLVKVPLIGARVAGYFWEVNALNVFADTGNFVATTQTINGSQRGASDRYAYYLRARAAL